MQCPWELLPECWCHIVKKALVLIGDFLATLGVAIRRSIAWVDLVGWVDGLSKGKDTPTSDMAQIFCLHSSLTIQLQFLSKPYTSYSMYEGEATEEA